MKEETKERKIFVEMTTVEYEQFISETIPNLEIGNVVENINTEYRFCIRNREELENVKKHIQSYKYICEHAHEDGRYDYLCSMPYCRCSE